MPNPAKLIFICTVALMCCFASDSAFAQGRKQPKITEATMDFLFRLDRNSNNMIDPNEMVGSSKKYLRTLGLDTSTSINLQSVAQLLENGGKPTAKTKSKKTESGYTQKVPGFGTGRLEEQKKGVARFGGGSSSSPIDMESKYGDRVMKLVNRTIQSYDANKNDALDPSEIRRARWGNPKPEESDQNGDGVLTKIELADRYLARERDAGRSPQTSGKQSSSRRPSKSQPASQKTERSPRSSSRNPTSSKGRSSSKKSTSRPGQPEQSTIDRYQRYADGLMTSYDKNKDGSLSADELGEMRRPPKNADQNGDGSVTRQELIDAVSGNSKPTPSRSSPTTPDPQAAAAMEAKSARNRNRGSSKSSSRSSSKSRKPRASSSFAELDENGDNQVQMSEFAKDWDGEIVAQFQAKDLDGDGLITVEEWNGQGN